MLVYLAGGMAANAMFVPMAKNNASFAIIVLSFGNTAVA